MACAAGSRRGRWGRTWPTRAALIARGGTMSARGPPRADVGWANVSGTAVRGCVPVAMVEIRLVGVAVAHRLVLVPMRVDGLAVGRLVVRVLVMAVVAVAVDVRDRVVHVVVAVRSAHGQRD